MGSDGGTGATRAFGSTVAGSDRNRQRTRTGDATSAERGRAEKPFDGVWNKVASWLPGVGVWRFGRRSRPLSGAMVETRPKGCQKGPRRGQHWHSDGDAPEACQQVVRNGSAVGRGARSLPKPKIQPKQQVLGKSGCGKGSAWVVPVPFPASPLLPLIGAGKGSA